MAKHQHKKISSVIGVHFGATKMSVVEMRHTGSETLIVSKGSVDMRPGYMNPAVIASAVSIGSELVNLLKSLGVTTHVAIFDIPATYTTVRSFNFPNMPDEDIRSVVDGEVRHAHVLADTGGAFDFIRVGGISTTGEASIVAMAADDAILWHIADIAKHARLKMLARVPSHIAMLRTLLLGAPPEKPTLYVTISSSTTEISIVSTNGIQMYRRLDVRGGDLLVESARLEEIAKLEQQSDGLLQEDVPLALQAMRTGGKSMLDPVITQRLLTETRRSVEFLRRTHPEDAAISRTILSISDEKWKDIQPALAESIGVPCSIASASKWPGMESTSNADDYFSALGLASQAFSEDGFAIPEMNLESSTKRTEKVIGTHSGANSAAVAAGVLFVVFLVSWVVFWLKSNSQESENNNLQADYVKLEATYLPQQEAFKAEVEAIADLATKGIPFGPIMDEMALSLDPTVGIIAATFEIGGRLTMQGQAGSEAAIVNTLGKLRQIGGFNETNVDSFEDRKDKGLVFNISTNYDLTFPVRRAAELEKQALIAGKVDGGRKILDEVVKQ